MTECVYVVQRINWEYSDEWYYPKDDMPVKAFRSRDEAEQYQKVVENEVRKELAATPSDDWRNRWNRELDSTFGLGRLHLLTSLSRDELREQVKLLELADFDNYNRPIGMMFSDAEIPAEWWSYVWGTLRPEQWEAFWSLFDRVVFYEVVEVELQP